MSKTFAERCQLAQQFLPDAQYKALLTALHAEMLEALAEQQEVCGYEHHEYRPYGAPGEVRIHAVLASQYTMPDGTIANDFQWLIDEYKADPNTIKLLPLYTTPQAPAAREWAGLTDDVLLELLTGVDEQAVRLPPGLRAFARAIEAKLKEKNHA